MVKGAIDNIQPLDVALPLRPPIVNTAVTRSTQVVANSSETQRLSHVK